MGHNYAGMKWSEWQRAYGCRPVHMDTWEVIDDRRMDLTAAFCSCPSWEGWLQVYAALLPSERYRPALQYAADPMLYGIHVWRLGWATDPAYIAGLSGWVSLLWPDYANTVATPPVGRPVEIRTESGKRVATGWLRDPDGPGPEGHRTVARVAELVAGLGLVHRWDPDGPAVYIDHPGTVEHE